MKKIRIGLILLLMLGLLSGCKGKTPLSPEGFTVIMEEAGFAVEDVTSARETDGLATTLLVAEGEHYGMEFYQLTDEATAQALFFSGKNVFEEEHRTQSVSVSLTMPHYNYYAFNAEGDFHLIARVADTMIYCTAEKEYRSEIQDLVKKMGYK